MAGLIRNVLKYGHFSNVCCRHILTRATLQLRNSQRILTRPITKYSQDIILYQYERRGFYKILGVASLSQLVFWSYMSYVMYVYIRPASQILQEHILKDKTAENQNELIKEFKYFPKFLLDSKTQTGVSITSLGMGILFFFTGCIYALRSVNQLVLLRNGARIIVKTYTPFGTTKQFSVPLTDVCCLGSRLDEKAFVVFKIKDHRFYYMLDKRGHFMQPTLFDTTVGIKRWNL